MVHDSNSLLVSPCGGSAAASPHVTQDTTTATAWQFAPGIPVENFPPAIWVTETDSANLKTGRFVPVEIRVVAEENEALQSVGLEEHFARYPFSFDCEPWYCRRRL
jgi:hypothetical protein